jgi:hypothetical protein
MKTTGGLVRAAVFLSRGLPPVAWIVVAAITALVAHSVKAAKG